MNKRWIEPEDCLIVMLLMLLLLVCSAPARSQVTHDTDNNFYTLQMPIAPGDRLASVWAYHEAAYTAQPAPLAASACKAQLPYGTPSPKKAIICRAGYVLDYDAKAKIPVWDAHVLTPAHTIGCVPRSNAFAADSSITDPAKPSDYLHSGYDIGHMSPDADFTYDATLERQTFYLTNMAPQLPGLNRQTWKYLEDDIRAWAYGRNHAIWIITGPIYDSSDKTIGADKVNVPTAFYKVIVDTKTGDTLAFIMPQKAGLGADLSKFIVTTADVEKASGIMLPKLPAKADSTLWPVDAAAYNSAKKDACSGDRALATPEEFQGIFHRYMALLNDRNAAPTAVDAARTAYWKTLVAELRSDD